MLNKLEERIVRKDLSERATKLLSKTAKKKTDAYVVGDFFDKITKVPNKSIEFVELDPPYAIDLPQQKAKDNYSIIYGDSYNEVASNQYIEFIQNVLEECYRVMSDESWMIVWFGPEPWFDLIYHMIISAGKPENVKLEDWTKGKKGFQTRRLLEFGLSLVARLSILTLTLQTAMKCSTT